MALERTDPLGSEAGPVSRGTQPTRADASSTPSWVLPLARAGQVGDREEFDRLFDAWFRMIYSLAWSRTQSVERAELWTTTAFVSALQRFLSERERDHDGCDGVK